MVYKFSTLIVCKFTYDAQLDMVALDNSAIVVRFAALDNLSHIAVDLKHPLFPCKKFTFSFREIKV